MLHAGHFPPGKEPRYPLYLMYVVYINLYINCRSKDFTSSLKILWQQGLVGNLSNSAGGNKQVWIYKMVVLYKEKCFLWV